ncbi:MAG: hypothetical protein RL020_520 [Pseudomonadota bacterium]|jgi:hypothetical protein
MSEHQPNKIIPEHLMLSRLAQSEQMREFFIQMWLQNPALRSKAAARYWSFCLRLRSISRSVRTAHDECSCAH